VNLSHFEGLSIVIPVPYYMKTLVLSANKNTGLETTEGISLTNICIVNSTGPNTEPCSTPLVTGKCAGPLSTTCCCLFDKKSFHEI